MGIGLLLVVSGVFVGAVAEPGGEDEVAAEEVGPEPLPDCCTDPQALREISVRVPATAAATARLMLRLTHITVVRFPIRTTGSETGKLSEAGYCKP